MKQNNNLSFSSKKLNEYSQLGFGQHLSSQKIIEQRNQMRKSWENIMKKNGIVKKII